MFIDTNPVFHYVRAMMDVAATLPGDVAPWLRIRPPRMDVAPSTGILTPCRLYRLDSIK